MNISDFIEEGFKELSKAEIQVLITIESAFILDELYRVLSEQLLSIVILGRFNKSAMVTLSDALSTIHTSLLEAEKGKNN